MKKVAIWAVAIVIVLFGGFKILQANTKSKSPEATVEINENGKTLKIRYCQPSMRGRKIFGGLVPFGEVWRTGANEATTFETSGDLGLNGKLLPAGKYTLWTIPRENTWVIIFNKKQYNWGVSMGGKAARNPAEDALVLKVTPNTLPTPEEKFVIEVFRSPDGKMGDLGLKWENTSVGVCMMWR